MGANGPMHVSVSFVLYLLPLVIIITITCSFVERALTLSTYSVDPRVYSTAVFPPGCGLCSRALGLTRPVWWRPIPVGRYQTHHFRRGCQTLGSTGWGPAEVLEAGRCPLPPPAAWQRPGGPGPSRTTPCTEMVPEGSRSDIHRHSGRYQVTGPPGESVDVAGGAHILERGLHVPLWSTVPVCPPLLCRHSPNGTSAPLLTPRAFLWPTPRPALPACGGTSPVQTHRERDSGHVFSPDLVTKDSPSVEANT